MAEVLPPRRSRGRVATFIGRHPLVLTGGILLGIMVFIALFAPELGTVDPTGAGAGQAAASAFRRVLVRHGHAGPRRLLAHALRRPRLPPRRLGGRPSLLRHRRAHRHRLGLRPRPRSGHHADHGRADVHPLHPAGGGADGAEPRVGDERRCRHHHCRDAARGPAGARRRAEPARAALCRGGGDLRARGCRPSSPGTSCPTPWRR